MTAALRKRHFYGRTVGPLFASIVLAALGLATSEATAAPVHKVTLVMREFRFEPAVLHLKVGEEVVLTIRNKGQVEHEWVIGRGVVNNQDEKGYRQDLLAILKPRVTGRHYDLEKVSTAGNSKDMQGGEYPKAISTEVEVERGGVVTLRFTVPASAKGEWEMGCFIPGHYESSMKGKVVIE